MKRLACAACAAALGLALLPGCAGSPASPGEAADWALEGLARAVEGALGKLSHAVDEAREAARAATGDAAPEAMVEAFDAWVDANGERALTPDEDLCGMRVREAGGGGYTGTYAAAYRDFSGAEVVFGGTSVDAPGGRDAVEVTVSLDVAGGQGAVFVREGADDPRVLLDGSGSLTATVEVGEGSTYLGVWGSGFEGSVALAVE